MILPWEKIDNEKKFQQLVNDLFALELNRPGYLPSSSYIGKDGGWDGRFDLPYLGVEGLSQVQVKWTKHTLDAAFPAIRGELIGALDNAKRDGVKNLYFATNAEFRIGTDGHVGKLEDLNNNHVDKLFIYHREALRPLIERSPWIQHKYFDLPQKPLFTPFSDYFKDSEPDISTTEPVLERIGELKEVEDFIGDNKKKVLILQAAQGEGKSRFLFEIGKLLQDKSESGWQGWFCRPSMRSVEDAMQDEIHSGKKYIIFLDNADMYEEVAKKLLDIISKYPASSFKLVLTVRTPAKDKVENLIKEKRIFEVSKLELQRLTDDTLKELLQRSAGKKTFEHPDRIVKSLGYNPFFVIAYGKLVKGDGDVGELKSQIINSLESGSEAIKSLGFNSIEIKTLLTQVALNVPLRMDNDEPLRAIAGTMGKAKENIIKAIEKLVEVRIMRNVGETVRFSSDLNGNVYLGTILDGVDGISVATKAYNNADYPTGNIISNISSASPNMSTNTAATFAAKIIEDFILKADSISSSEKIRNLSWVNRIASLAPEESLNLLTIYLEDQSLTRDDVGETVSVLLNIPGYQHQTLDVVLKLVDSDVKGRYSNYEPNGFIKSATSPLSTNSIDLCISSMEVLDKWVTAESLPEKHVDLIVAGIEEALAGSHELRDSYANTITIGRRGLIFSAKLEEYRTLALNVYSKLIHRSEPEYQIKALQMYNRIGSEVFSKEGLLWDRVVSDRTKALSWIAELLDSESTDESTIAEIEDTLILLWSNNTECPELSSEAEKLLLKIKHPVEFQVYKLLSNNDFSITDFQSIKDSAPADNRWAWLVENHMRKYRIPHDDLSDMVLELSKKYTTSEEVLDYLIGLDSKVTASTTYIPLIETWGEKTPDVFLEILKDQAMTQRFPERFKDSLYRVGAVRLEGYIDDFAKDLINKESITPLDIDRFMDLCIKKKSSADFFMTHLRAMIPKIDGSGRRVILSRCYYLFEGFVSTHKDLLLELISRVAKSGFSEEHLDSYDFLLHNINKDSFFNKEDIEGIKEAILPLIKDRTKLNDNDSSLLAKLFLDDVDEFLDFLQYRLDQNKLKKGDYLQVVPYDGFKEVVTNLTKDNESFIKLMNRVISWKDTEMISSYDIENILKHVGNKEQNIISYIESKVNENTDKSIQEAIVASYGLDFGDSTLKTYVLLLESAEKHSLLSDSKAGLVHNVLIRGYMGTMGEIPPALLQRRADLEKMYGMVKAGRIKVFIRQLIDSNEVTIKSSTKGDAEMLDPKS